jgi:hypothetical protein
LRVQTNWRNADTAAYLRIVVEQWRALMDITV